MKTPFMIAASLLIAQPALAQKSFEIPVPPPKTNTIQQQSLDQLPPTNTSGQHIIQDQTVQQNIGYNPSRAWEPGARASEIITVGDVSTSSGKKITLQDTAAYSGRNLNQIKLKDVGPISQASLIDLVRAYPELGRMRVNQVPLFNDGEAQKDRLEEALGPEGAAAIRAFAAKYPLLQDLPLRRISKGKWDAILEGGAQIALVELSRKYPVLADIRIKDLKSIDGLARTGLRLYDRFSNGQTINEVIRNEPELSKVPLGAVFDLEKEGVESIPGIEKVALNDIPGANESAVERVPGLKNVPIDKLFGHQLSNVMFAQFDLAHSGDQIAPEVVSGETPLNKFRIKACSSNKPGGCSNIELIKLSGWPIPGIHGKRWVEGKVQIVDGCINSLCKVANKEQGGIKYNDALNWKAVLMKVDEGGGGKPATATFGVAFQLRYVDPSGTPHASSHFLGPFPVSKVPVKTPIPVAADLSPNNLFGQGDASNEVPSQFSNQVALQTPGNLGGTGGGAEERPCAPSGHVCKLLQPVNAARIHTIANIYGACRDGCSRKHAGIDLFSPSGVGSPVVSPARGEIVQSYWSVNKKKGQICGGAVRIRHTTVPYDTRHLHLSHRAVKVGQIVERGQQIGKEGVPPRNCGSGSHDHYEVYEQGGGTVNPACVPHEPPFPATATDGTPLTRYRKC